MNILIIGPIPKQYGGKKHGGIATHNFGLTNELIANGNDVKLWYHNYLGKPNTSLSKNLSIESNNYLSILYFIIQFKYFFNKEISFLSLKKRILFILQLASLKKILKYNEVDIIHIHSIHNTFSLSKLFLDQKHQNIPFIGTDHGFWQSDTSSKEVIKLKEICKSLDRVIYISEFALEHHKQFKLCPETKLVKIPNPIIFESTNQLANKSTTSKKILFFNGLSESIKRKGLIDVLSAIESDSNLTSKVKLLALVNENGKKHIQSHSYNFEIEILPAMNWEEIKKLYTKSDLMILPSKSESFGLVYIEALMFGIPIIGFNKVVEEFKYKFNEYIGESYDPLKDDTINLSKKISTALNTPFNKKSVINKVKSFYDWKICSRSFISLYTSLIKKSEL